MTMQGAGDRRIIYLVAVAAVTLWAILGVMDMSNTTYTGYTTTPQNVVNQVQAGSPAEAAGLTVGDEIESFAGVPIQDMAALNRLPRTVPGETREIGVMRDGQAMTLQITYGGLAGVQSALAWAALIAGLVFLFAPFFASARSRAPASKYLGWFGVCFALAMITGPYIASVGLRNLIGTVQLTAIVFGFALLLRFVLAFPHDSMAGAGTGMKLAVWGPAAIIALLFIWLNLAEPAATSGLNSVVSLLVGVFVIGYFGASLLVLIQRYRAATPPERADSGLSLMLWGAVIGLVPLLLASIIGLVAPMVVLPGQQFYFLTLALIPIAFSMAVTKPAAQAGAPAEAAVPA